MRDRRLDVVIAICLLVILSLYVTNLANLNNYTKERISSVSLWNLRNHLSADQKMPERTDILFLKTHKCGSSTVQNIIMRFGYRRHLDFVLPPTANYLGHPKIFNRDMVPENLTSPSTKYNIFTHHTRYNFKEMKAIMKENAAFVTILRNPVDLFESLFQFYHLEKQTNMTLQEAVKSPAIWERMIRLGRKKMGTNQMSFDLGMNHTYGESPSDKQKIKNFINRMDEEFDLVMIMEHMEVSLILLCDLMKWPLENVAYLKANSRQQTSKMTLTEEDRNAILKINKVDTLLYEHFLSKFKTQIVEYGVEKMKNQVKRLIDLNSNLWAKCVNKPNTKGYAQTQSYDLRNPLDFDCAYSIKTELSFTDEIRNDQIRRFAPSKALDKLLEDI